MPIGIQNKLSSILALVSMEGEMITNKNRIKMLRKYGFLFLISLIFLVPIPKGSSQSNLYTPGVKVNDILVWDLRLTSEGETIKGNLRHEIVTIENLTGGTRISANVQVDGDEWITEVVASLYNYSDFPPFLLKSIFFHEFPDIVFDNFSYENYYIIPGTKFTDYVENFCSYWDINGEDIILTHNGYGIKITIETFSLTRVFNEQGILVQEESDEFSTGFHTKMTLKSINGQRYYIPGYSLPIFLGCMMLGILGVFFYTKRRIGLE